MDYYEVSVSIPGELDPDIIVAEMGAAEFESFSDSENGLLAYMPADAFDETAVRTLMDDLTTRYGIGYSLGRIAAQNWNAIWESAYEPVVIDGRCLVRAPFHPADPSVKYEIIIMPRMSFGTAHHATTANMLGLMMEEDLQGKRVLDMGCGTGVLAILAKKMGASEVTAIDNDEWAYSNALDNMAANGASAVTVIQGDAGDIPAVTYDLIAANINRNILLRDIPAYVKHLAPGGIIHFSGFYTEDLPAITEAAVAAGLKYDRHRVENNWVGARFVR